MTTRQITTSPGGYEAHDRRKRMWLAAERAKVEPADAAPRRRHAFRFFMDENGHYPPFRYAK